MHIIKTILLSFLFCVTGMQGVKAAAPGNRFAAAVRSISKKLKRFTLTPQQQTVAPLPAGNTSAAQAVAAPEPAITPEEAASMPQAMADGTGSGQGAASASPAEIALAIDVEEEGAAECATCCEELTPSPITKTCGHRVCATCVSAYWINFPDKAGWCPYCCYGSVSVHSGKKIAEFFKDLPVELLTGELGEEIITPLIETYNPICSQQVRVALQHDNAAHACARYAWRDLFYELLETRLENASPEVVAAFINKQNVITGSTPLHMAMANRCIPMVYALIEAGADVNIKDNFGYTIKDLAEERPFSPDQQAELLAVLEVAEAKSGNPERNAVIRWASLNGF